MTYTISTEPVTEEHIGRRVLVVDTAYRGRLMLQEGTLTDVERDDFSDVVYRVNGAKYVDYSYAILIVEN